MGPKNLRAAHDEGCQPAMDAHSHKGLIPVKNKLLAEFLVLVGPNLDEAQFADQA